MKRPSSCCQYRGAAWSRRASCWRVRCGSSYDRWAPSSKLRSPPMTTSRCCGDAEAQARYFFTSPARRRRSWS
eukprot:9162955-Pyramimonas_sp.AAC.1